MVKNKCPYCTFKEDTDDILTGDFYDEDYVSGQLKLDDLKTGMALEVYDNFDGSCINIHVNYCPWCGRNLNND